MLAPSWKQQTFIRQINICHQNMHLDGDYQHGDAKKML
jgi:hypothetical protein